MIKLKEIFEKIWALARPYLNTRRNDIHTEMSTRVAYMLLAEIGGDEDIVIPAIILHDVGWKKVPENLQLRAFGPRATSRELNRMHEVEGVKIAGDILKKVNYKADRIEEILKIIDGHDSRKEANTLNDRIVKDADKLWRYSKEGFYIDIERFDQTFKEGLNRLRSNINKWFLTNYAKELAIEELENRVRSEESERMDPIK